MDGRASQGVSSFLLFVGLVALALAATPLAAQTTPRAASVRRATLVVVVAGLRSDAGRVVGGLYDDASAWLVEDAAREDCHATIRGGTARCVFHVDDVSTVAFAALHDEDDDGVLDRDLVGLPQEGYAFSNDVREPFGPPSFAAASFLADRPRPFVVHARYWI